MSVIPTVMGPNWASGTKLSQTPSVPKTLSRPYRQLVKAFQGSSLAEGTTVISSVKVCLKIPYRCHFGQNLAIVGATDTLGNWNPQKAVPMNWTSGDWWTAEITVKPGLDIELEYKYVVVNNDGHISRWKPGSNYKLQIPLVLEDNKLAGRVAVADAWDESFKDVQVLDQICIRANCPAAEAPKPQEVSCPPPATSLDTAASTVTAGVPSSSQTTSPNLQVATATTNTRTVTGSGDLLTDTILEPSNSAGNNIVPAAPSATSSSSISAGVHYPNSTGSSIAVPPHQQSGLPVQLPAGELKALVLHARSEEMRLQEAIKAALGELQATVAKHKELKGSQPDAAALQVIQADRLVAAANNKVVAYNKALKAIQAYQPLAEPSTKS